ncbi:hypothetical protein F511_02664 [Dorcoceras hygrometricum]|uniref:Uncharacterized protein n=1 Tax=Dorcoceras hygrometricum TaxID=472368 RepID=A0A2Z7D661_9LAMI|nr:hypothetical protein F511_02664 [Dorcoceras hygrometricum]
MVAKKNGQGQKETIRIGSQLARAYLNMLAEGSDKPRERKPKTHLQLINVKRMENPRRKMGPILGAGEDHFELIRHPPLLPDEGDVRRPKVRGFLLIPWHVLGPQLGLVGKPGPPNLGALGGAIYAVGYASNLTWGSSRHLGDYQLTRIGREDIQAYSPVPDARRARGPRRGVSSRLNYLATSNSFLNQMTSNLDPSNPNSMGYLVEQTALKNEL